MSQSPSPRNSTSSPSPSRYSYSSRSPSPSRKTLLQEFESVFANDFYYKISICILIFLACITLSFSFPDNDPKTLDYPEFLKKHKNSMQTFTQILFVISFIYFVTAFIIRRQRN